ncbi:hypothetical protein [Adlercreutzia sp. ZJ154]|uniref:hypothetical protein n=1 Tax=Adlercreutzia sp. ZJ154 TaxID=2709790 RepID=UPI0013EC897B|nr:hypothetical protein [Adlercreutzia sp. ZJ154]
MSYTTVTEPKQKRKGKKALTAGLSVTLALAIGVPATFAAVTGALTPNNDSNPPSATTSYTAARLHDDFNGFKDGHDKNVYFENYVTSSDTVTANPVLVRAKLTHEYKTQASVSDAEQTVIAADTALAPTANNQYTSGDIAVTLGGSGEFYMPTFNKNINSTDNDVRSSKNPSPNYTDWALDQAAQETEIGYDGASSAEAVEHKAKAIPASQVFSSVTEWTTAGSPAASWVYDTDGFYYWASAVQPGEVTGLLINDAAVNSTSGWNYTINVQGTYADINEPCVKDGKYYFDKDGTMEMSEGIYNMFAKSLGRVNATQSAAIAAAEIGSGEVNIDDTKFTIIGRNEKTREAVLLTSQENKVSVDQATKPIEAGVSFDKTWVNTYINSAEADGWLANKPTIASCAVAKDYAFNISGKAANAVNQKITLPTLGDTVTSTFNTYRVDGVNATFDASTGLNMTPEMVANEALVRNLCSGFSADDRMLISTSAWNGKQEAAPLTVMAAVYLDGSSDKANWENCESASSLYVMPMFVIRY